MSLRKASLQPKGHPPQVDDCEPSSDANEEPEADSGETQQDANMDEDEVERGHAPTTARAVVVWCKKCESARDLQS